MAALEQQRATARRELLAALEGDGYRLLLARLRLPRDSLQGSNSVRLERVAHKEFRRLTKAVDRLGRQPKDGGCTGFASN